MSNFLSLKFWFNFRPGPLLPGSLQIFVIIIVALIVFTIATALIKARNQKNLYGRFWQNIYTFFLTNAIFGLLFLFFVYELIPFLSARFWFILWTAGIITWLIFIARVLLAVPKRKKELEEDKEFKKYIP